MKRFAALSQRVCTALILLAACPLAAPAATRVDLRGVVNNGLEDDGIIGNGAGGWSDEGVNDLFTWPPVPSGPGPHNGIPITLIDPASNDPMRVRRRYWDTSPREFEVDGVRGADHPHTITSVFTQLQRSNFRVDTLLEPEPAESSTSAYYSEIMGWVPATLVVRAQKEGI